MIVFFTLGGSPLHRFFRDFQIPVMANAYYDSDIRAVSEFGGRVWVDSGGYQAMVKGEVLPLPQILSAYRRVKAEAYISPDVPPLPSDPPEVAEWKMRLSYLRYVEVSREMDVVPVIHVYHNLRLTWRYAKMYLDLSPPRLAVGGAVPYLFSRAKGRRRVLRFIEELRSMYKGWIHVLGAGAPTVIAELARLGVDSTDSATWRLKAAYGKVVIPCGGERHVTQRQKRFGGKTASREELEELYRFLKATGFPALDGFYERIKTSFKYRALVNAWVIQHQDKCQGEAWEKYYRKRKQHY